MNMNDLKILARFTNPNILEYSLIYYWRGGVAAASNGVSTIEIKTDWGDCKQGCYTVVGEYLDNLPIPIPLITTPIGKLLSVLTNLEAFNISDHGRIISCKHVKFDLAQIMLSDFIGELINEIELYKTALLIKSATTTIRIEAIK